MPIYLLQRFLERAYSATRASLTPTEELDLAFGVALLLRCDGRMALPEPASLFHSELNGFLFTTMGTEENGATFSVLSGLTQFGIDPWIEDVRLAKLPKEAAAR